MSALPANLEAKLQALAARTRRGQVVQGVGRLAIVLVLFAVAFILIDANYGSPAWLRGCLLACWAGTAALLGKLWILDPCYEALDRRGLAAIVEKRYPRLGERLLTAVELAEQPDAGNGSEAWMEELIAEADKRTKTLDFETTVPLRGYWIFAGFAAFAVIVMLVPLCFVENAGSLVKRFAMPWRDPALDAGFRFVVATRDLGVQRGGAVTLSGYFEPLHADAKLPTNAQLISRRPGEPDEAREMTLERGNVAYLKRDRVDADFQYRLQSGPVSTDWFRVTVVDPVDLAGGAAIVAPAYTKRPEVIVAGLGDIDCLQYSKLKYALEFSRPPVAAWIEWTPENAIDAVKIPLELTGTKATAVVPVRQAGGGRLRLQVEQGVLIDWPAQPMRVKVDQPPRFTQVAGLPENPRAVRPVERMPVRFELADDIGLGPVFLEYRINQKETAQIPVPVTPVRDNAWQGSVEFDLNGKVKDGDKLEYRLVAFDNRDLPEEKLGPQRVLFPPADHWVGLDISNSADPLEDQDILDRKKKFEERIRAFIKELETTQGGVHRVRTETVGKKFLPGDLINRLRDLREKTGLTREGMVEFAKEADLVPDMKPLADGVRQVEAGPVADAETNLADIQRGEAEERPAKFDRTLASAAEAVKRLEALLALNDDLTKKQLTRQRIERLGKDERSLADGSKGADANKSAELDAKQKEMRERLKKLVESDESLRNAMSEGEKREARDLTEKLNRLLKDTRDLSDAARETLKQERSGRLADLASRQKELADKLADFARRTDPTARANRISPPPADSARRAGEELRDGRPAEALENQAKAALDIERYAEELRKAAARTRDPREAARQLANLQDGLRSRVAEATKDKALKDLPAEEQAALRGEQKALADAARSLSLPPDSSPLETDRANAAKEADEAEDRLAKKTRPEIDDAMQKARDAMLRLAERIPPLEKRQATARKDLGDLRKELETLTRQTEQTVRPLEKQPPTERLASELAFKLAESVRKLEQLGERLAKLDLPDQKERIGKATDALKRALEDVKAGRAQDIVGSQQKLRRELEALEQAVAGQKTNRERAAELVTQQKELAEDVDRLSKKVNPDREKLADQAKRQAELNRKIQALNPGEAPRDQLDALTLTRKAEQAMVDAKADEMRKAAKDAGEALQRMVERMAGDGMPREQAERMSKTQKRDAEQVAGKKLDPTALSEQRKQVQSAIDELRQIPGGDAAAPEKQQALEKLQKALLPAQTAELAKARKEAADAVRKFADRLPTEQPPPVVADKPKGPSALPQVSQAEEAAKLAEEQKKLQQETLTLKDEMKNPPAKTEGNPLQDLIAKQKGVLVDAAKAKADDAIASGLEAVREMVNGRIAAARELARAAEAELKKLPDQALAKREAEIVKKLEEMDPADAKPQQAARLEELKKQANELEGPFQPHSKGTVEKLRNAESSMAKSQAQAKENRPEEANQSLRDAVQKLEEAMKLQPKPESADNPNAAKAGQNLREADRRMEEARKQLAERKPDQAEPEMQKAADALQEAAKNFGKPPGGKDDSAQGNSPGMPNPKGGKTPQNLPPELAPLAGKAWGELPGEVKAKILQDMKARYGEDYAIRIRHYFESLAERK